MICLVDKKSPPQAMCPGRLWCLFWSLFVCFLALGFSDVARAEDPDSAFLKAYTEFQNAERLEQSGDSAQALSKYRFAASLLEQIARNSPEWQPMIVQYRLRKITEALGRIETSVPSIPAGGQTGSDVYYEGDLPAFDSPRGPSMRSAPSTPGYPRTIPDRSTVPPGISSTPRTSAEPVADRELAALRRDNQVMRDQIAQLTAELKSSRHEVDKTLVTVVELRHELMQAKTRLEDAMKDRGTVEEARKEFAKQIEEISTEIEKTRAERQVLEEENERLQQKLEQAASYIADSDEIRKTLETEREGFFQERETARADRDKVQQELQSTLAELESSRTRLAELESLATDNQTLREEKQSLQERLDISEARAGELTAQTKELEQRLAEATSPEELAAIKAAHEEALAVQARTMAGLEEKQEVLSAELELLRQADSRQEPLQQQLDELAAKLAKAETEKKQLAAQLEEKDTTTEESPSAPDPEMQERLASAEAARAAFQAEKEALEQKLADLANAAGVSEALTEELEAARKDLAELAAAREEQAALAVKLGEAEARIGVMETQISAKDDSIERLQSEVHSVSDRLFAMRGELAARDNKIQALEKQLDETAAELAELKLNPKPSPEEQQARLETELLRGILVRQLREQARRDQARRLIEEEISALEIQSTSLRDNLAILGQGIELTEEEKSLFRLPVVDLAAESPDSLSATISITKPAGDDVVRPGGFADLSKEQQEKARAAQAALREGHMADAEPIWAALAEEEPDNFFVLSQLAATQVQSGKTRAARVALDKAMSLQPEDAFTHSVLGVVRFRQGDLPGAEEALRKAIALDPSLPRPYNHLGIVVSQKGDIQGAEELLVQATKTDPKYAEAYFNLAVLYATVEPPRKTEAVEAYQKALDLGARSDAALERLLQN